MTEHEAKRIWEEWYPLIYGYFFRRVNNRQEVEEMTGNTLTALIMKYSSVSNTKAFIWQTAANQLKVYLTKKSKAVEIVELDDYFTSTKHPQDLTDNVYSLHYSEFISELKKCIDANLNSLEKEIVTESILEEKKSPQIAEKFKLKPATVRQKLRRAILKLKSECVNIWKEFKNNS